MPPVTATERLETLGWDEARAQAFEDHAAAGLAPGRVVSQGRGMLRAEAPDGPVAVIVQRGARRAATSSEDRPAVGDWLALEPVAPGQAALRAVLPRTSAFVRRDGDRDVHGQVVAANVDTVLLVSALTRDLNMRRMERYLALAWSSGAQPVVVLNKADLCDDLDAAMADVSSVAGDTPVHALSAATGDGLEQLRRYLIPGATVALLGSSGVGKSTLTNALLGEARQLVRDVRDDDHRGRHTTTSRELVELPSGALLIDTPGLRSVGLWDAEDGVDATFADIEELATHCRFADCSHEVEPGCAVQAAIAAGLLQPDRLAARRKLQRELGVLARRGAPDGGRSADRRFGKMIHHGMKVRSRLEGWEHGR
jgi:ribosome biogenesis GTPase